MESLHFPFLVTNALGKEMSMSLKLNRRPLWRMIIPTDEIDVDELERRLWRDKMRLKRLKEQSKSKEGSNTVKQRQSQEQARRKISRAQDGILKYMLKMMEEMPNVCRLCHLCASTVRL